MLSCLKYENTPAAHQTYLETVLPEVFDIFAIRLRPRTSNTIASLCLNKQVFYTPAVIGLKPRCLQDDVVVISSDELTNDDLDSLSDISPSLDELLCEVAEHNEYPPVGEALPR